MLPRLLAVPLVLLALGCSDHSELGVPGAGGAGDGAPSPRSLADGAGASDAAGEGSSVPARRDSHRPALPIRASSIRPDGRHPSVGWGDGEPWVEVAIAHPVPEVELIWRHAEGDPNPLLREASGDASLRESVEVPLDFAPTAVTAVRTHLGGERIVWVAGIATDPVRELVVERWALSAPEVERDDAGTALRLVPGRVAHRERFTLPERAHAEDAVVALAPLGHLEWGARRVLALLGGNAELVEVDLALRTARTVAAADGPADGPGGRLGPVHALRERWDGFELPFVHRDLGLCVVARDGLADVEGHEDLDRVQGVVLFGGPLFEEKNEERAEWGRPVPVRIDGSQPLTARNEAGYQLLERALPVPAVEIRPVGAMPSPPKDVPPAGEPPPSWARLSLRLPEDRWELVKVEIAWLEPGVGLPAPSASDSMGGGAIAFRPSEFRWTRFADRRMSTSVLSGPGAAPDSIPLAPGRYRIVVRDAGPVDGLPILTVEEIDMGYDDLMVAFDEEQVWGGRARIEFDLVDRSDTDDVQWWLVVHRRGSFSRAEVPSRESRTGLHLSMGRSQARLYIDFSTTVLWDRYTGGLPVVHWLPPGEYHAEAYVREPGGDVECTALVAFEVADDDLTVDLTD